MWCKEKFSKLVSFIWGKSKQGGDTTWSSNTLNAATKEVMGSRQVVTGFNHSEEDLSQRKRYPVAKIIKDGNSWPTEAVGYARQICVCLS